MRTIATLAAAIFLPSLAYAQVTTTGSSSQSNNAAEAIAVGGGLGGGGSGYEGLHDSGHVWNTPSVYAPSFANANPCSQPVSAGGAGGPIGLTFGFSPENASCERLQKAAALWTLARGLGSSGLATAAVALMCQDRAVADAVYEGTGTVCPGRQNDKRYAKATGVFMVSGATARPASVQEPVHTAWTISPHAQQVLADGSRG